MANEGTDVFDGVTATLNGMPEADRDAARPWWDRLEVPTWLLIVVVYGGWALTLAGAGALPWWVVSPLGAVFVAWHAHLQHELIHGHPTRWPWLNALFGCAPLSLWVPYPLYRETHMRHHAVDDLTLPGEDPESYYVTRDQWERLGPVARGLLTANQTLAGRFVIGPWLVVARWWWAEARRMMSGDLTNAGHWAVHAVLVGALLWGVSALFGMPAWFYVLGVAWPGVALAMVRSYLEHRPATVAGERTAVVESNAFWRLLFLCNNLHVVHHDRPGLPWYRIPAVYRAERDAIRRRNGGWVFSGYGEVARRFLFRPKDLPVHPA